MLGEARRRLGGSNGRRFLGGHRAVNFYQEGLQDFTPRAGRFDVVWLQWGLMYLPDGGPALELVCNSAVSMARIEAALHAACQMGLPPSPRRACMPPCAWSEV